MPFSFQVPGDGVYKTDDQGTLLIKVGNTLYQTGLQDLGARWLQSQGLPYGQNGANDINAGRQYLQSIGVTLDSLPQLPGGNVADVLGNASKLGLSFSNNLDLSVLPKLLKTQQTAGTTATLNTDPSLQGFVNPNMNYVPTAAAPSAGGGSTGGTGSTGITGIQPPTVNLQPGDTGAQVKQLQDYLVSKGLMTRAQVDTGYGTYGPQTTAAVAALQQQLGVDNSTGVGYFGPRTISAIGASAPSGGMSGGTSAGASSPSEVNPELLAILNNPYTTPDQKAATQAIYNAIVSGNGDTASKLQAAMKAASEFSDPYFKAQIRLATDALQRGLTGKEGDLAFAEAQQRSALEELQNNVAASKDKLSLDHAQELKNLETKYQTDLQDTQDNLAASGFTSSSKRSRTEQILKDQNEGLVESSNRGYSYQTGSLDRALTANTSTTQAQIANLQRLASEGKLDLLRQTEAQVGTNNLSSLGYSGLLGSTGTPIGGSIPRTQVQDAFSFASNAGFVF